MVKSESLCGTSQQAAHLGRIPSRLLKNVMFPGLSGQGNSSSDQCSYSLGFLSVLSSLGVSQKPNSVILSSLNILGYVLHCDGNELSKHPIREAIPASFWRNIFITSIIPSDVFFFLFLNSVSNICSLQINSTTASFTHSKMHHFNM